MTADEYVAQLVARAPTPTVEQLARVAAILTPARLSEAGQMERVGA